uniref:GDT1 family protein n=1 Tax=Acrobeloides nanus TaxID=290746 RepID=A0A914BXM9_9BILA
MSMRYSKSEVFSGAMAANIFMAIISALIGSFAQIIPRKIVAYISTIIFGIFGLKMILEAYKMKPNKFEHEYKEAEEEIRKDKNWFKEK